MSFLSVIKAELKLSLLFEKLFIYAIIAALIIVSCLNNKWCIYLCVAFTCTTYLVFIVTIYVLILFLLLYIVLY